MMVNYYASLYKAQKPQLLKKIKKSATTSYWFPSTEKNGIIPSDLLKSQLQVSKYSCP
jgi:hypothetical protein